MPLTLLSPAFFPGAEIPALYTCDGDNVAPPLGWSGAPAHTVSFALVVDDPDAPDPARPRPNPFVHWVVFNVPGSVRELPEAAAAAILPDGTREGMNDRKAAGYRGPCPQVGRHRYVFRLYALDTALDLHEPTKAELLSAMEGHVIEQTELVGMYQRT